MTSILAILLALGREFTGWRILSDSSRRSHRGNGSRSGHGTVTVDLGLGAIARDVAGFTTAVAGLSGCVERTAVGGSAVAGDVAKLAASVALHGLSLAVAGEMVRSTALVASCRATASKAAPEAATVRTTGSASAPSHARARVGAVTSQVAGEAARVASSAGAGAAQPEGWAVSLDMAEALAVVALLRLRGTRVRASVRFVAGLLACMPISGRYGWCCTEATYSCSRASPTTSTPLSVQVSPVFPNASHNSCLRNAGSAHGAVLQQRRRPRPRWQASREGELTSIVPHVSALEARTTRE